jgi:hypothetical protein
MFCTQCGANNAPGTRYCSNCGTPVSAQPQQQAPQGQAPPAQPQPVQQPSLQAPPQPHQAPSSSVAPQQGFAPSPQVGYQPAQPAYTPGVGTPGYPGAQRAGGSISFDFRRLGRGDLLSAGFTLLLFISLFLTWYSASGLNAENEPITISQSALGHYAGGWRFLILIMNILILLYLVARTLAPRGIRLPLPHWQVLTILLGIQLLLTLLGFLLKPSAVVNVAWEYGAYIGLVSAVLALGGGVWRKSDPEVIIAGAPHPVTSYGHAPVGYGPYGQQPPQQPMPQQPMPQQAAPPAPGGPQSGTPQCRNCGAAIPTGAPYCTNCGTPAG